MTKNLLWSSWNVQDAKVSLLKPGNNFEDFLPQQEIGHLEWCALIFVFPRTFLEDLGLLLTKFGTWVQTHSYLIFFLYHNYPQVLHNSSLAPQNGFSHLVGTDKVRHTPKFAHSSWVTSADICEGLRLFSDKIRFMPQAWNPATYNTTSLKPCLLHAPTCTTFGVHMYHDEMHKKPCWTHTLSLTGSLTSWFAVEILPPIGAISLLRTLTNSSYRFNNSDYTLSQACYGDSASSPFRCLDR